MRDTYVESIATAVVVLVFIAGVMALGSFYSGTSGQTLTATGGWAMVAAIGFFVVLMSVMGYWLAGRKGGEQAE